MELPITSPGADHVAKGYRPPPPPPTAATAVEADVHRALVRGSVLGVIDTPRAHGLGVIRVVQEGRVVDPDGLLGTAELAVLNRWLDHGGVTTRTPALCESLS